MYLYAHTHTHTPWGGTVYTEKSDGPACQSCGCSTMIDWFHSVPPHHQSEGGETAFININFFSHLYSYPHSYSSLVTQSRLGSFVCISADHCLRWRGGGLPWSYWHWHHFMSAGCTKLSGQNNFAGFIWVNRISACAQITPKIYSHCLIIFKVSNVVKNKSTLPCLFVICYIATIDCFQQRQMIRLT